MTKPNESDYHGLIGIRPDLLCKLLASLQVVLEEEEHCAQCYHVRVEDFEALREDFERFVAIHDLV